MRKAGITVEGTIHHSFVKLNELCSLKIGGYTTISIPPPCSTLIEGINSVVSPPPLHKKPVTAVYIVNYTRAGCSFVKLNELCSSIIGGDTAVLISPPCSTLIEGIPLDLTKGLLSKEKQELWIMKNSRWKPTFKRQLF